MIEAIGPAPDEVTQQIRPDDADSCALAAARRDAREIQARLLALLRHAQDHPECYERPGARATALAAARDTLEVAIGIMREVPE